MAASANAAVISWNYNSARAGTTNVTGTAGVVAAANWNNFTTTGTDLIDDSGAVTTADFTITGTYGAWSINTNAPAADGDGSFNENLLNGYANYAPGLGTQTLAISQIDTVGSYELYVYFSSDVAGRTGTLTLGGTTFDFATYGPASIAGSNAIFAQTTSTGGSNPTANYALFTGLSGASQSIALNGVPGGGIAGFQLVAVPEPSAAGLVLLGGFGFISRRRRS